MSRCQQLRNAVRALIGDERGDAAIQYALVASLVSVFLLSAYVAVGNAQTKVFEAWSGAVSAAIDRGGGGGGGGGGE